MQLLCSHTDCLLDCNALRVNVAFKAAHHSGDDVSCLVASWDSSDVQGCRCISRIFSIISAGAHITDQGCVMVKTLEMQMYYSSEMDTSYL